MQHIVNINPWRQLEGVGHIIGLHYNPLTNTFKLAPGVDVNYMLHTSAKKACLEKKSIKQKKK
jgi:2-polyprenyl-3-methyl-5-hydroxy-6-metoxy-1,4-benzoquinol methylase